MIKPTEEDYPGYLAALTSFARTLLAAVEQIDLAEMRAICERFQALGPILEPTAYQRGGHLNLADQAAFLKALEEFVAALRKLDRRPASGRTAPMGVNGGGGEAGAAHPERGV